jgi:hypothetical protein
MGSSSEKGQKHKKTTDLDSGTGMRMGYHSEKANPEDPGTGGGMRIGYHSEKANPSKHSKRLHKKSR